MISRARGPGSGVCRRGRRISSSSGISSSLAGLELKEEAGRASPRQTGAGGPPPDADERQSTDRSYARWRSFPFPADRAVLEVFEDDTMLGEFLTNAIGRGEIAPATCLLSLLDLFLDLCLRQDPRGHGIPHGLEDLGIAILEHSENRIGAGQEIAGRSGSRPVKLAPVHCRIGVAHEIEQHGQRPRRVQIVGQRIVEGSLDAPNLVLPGCIARLWQAFVFQSPAKIAEAFECTGGLCSPSKVKFSGCR